MVLILVFDYYLDVLIPQTIEPAPVTAAAFAVLLGVRLPRNLRLEALPFVPLRYLEPPMVQRLLQIDTLLRVRLQQLRNQILGLRRNVFPSFPSKVVLSLGRAQ